MSLRPSHVKAELVKREVPLVQIAMEFGVSRQLISRVINRQSASQRVQRRIAEIIQLPYTYVWGIPDPSHPSATSDPQPTKAEVAG